MKNNNHNHIRNSRNNRLHKTVATDILVNPEIVRKNQDRLGTQPRRKRRIDYAKKIMNDSFIMNA